MADYICAAGHEHHSLTQKGRRCWTCRKITRSIRPPIYNTKIFETRPNGLFWNGFKHVTMRELHPNGFNHGR